MIYPSCRGPVAPPSPRMAGSSQASAFPPKSSAISLMGTVRADGGEAGMARRAASCKKEAEQLRAAGWSYRQIVACWRERDGVNSRVAFRLAHGMTQADVA